MSGGSDYNTEQIMQYNHMKKIMT